MSPLGKKRKITNLDDENEENGSEETRKTLASLSRSITPPLITRGSRPPNTQHAHINHSQKNINSKRSTEPNDEVETGITEGHPRIIRSPIQLTHIRDLPANKNIDTVQLHDILGDPMIRECWQFNYCFDIDFVIDQFDEDVKDLVQVKIVHGSWKQDSPNRIRIDV